MYPNLLGLKQYPLDTCEFGEFDDSPRPRMYCSPKGPSEAVDRAPFRIRLDLAVDHVPLEIPSEPAVDLAPDEIPSERRRRRGRRPQKTKKQEERGVAAVGEGEYHCRGVVPLSEEHLKNLASEDAVLATKCPWPDETTTLMLRNIPNRYTAEELIAEMLVHGFEGGFDFFYLPVDFKTKRNKGYAFINFQSACLAKSFRDVFDDLRLLRYSTQKILEVTPAITQGFEANVAQFMRKDAQRIQNPWFRPMIFALAEGAEETEVDADTGEDGH